MAAVWLLVRSVVRRRWPALIALAMLIGLAGGVVLTAAAGARRTATAYPRLELWAHAAQLDLSPLGNGLAGLDGTGTGTTGYYAALRREPDVAYMSTAALLAMALPRTHGGPDLNVNVIGSLDQHPEDTADRVRVLAGTIFDPADPHAAMVDSQLAAAEHLRPGSTLHLLGILDDMTTPDLAHPVPLTFRVTAVVAFDDQVVPVGSVYAEPRVLLTPAFSASKAAAPFKTGEYAGIRLRPGASVTEFETVATTLAMHYHRAVGRIALISLRAGQAATQQAIRPQVIALAAFAALAGVIMLAIIGQLLARQITLDAAEFPILRALGMSPGRLALVSLLTVALVTGTGAAVAVGVAIAASPLMPIGPARLAEPSPGVEVNLTVLGLGFAALMLLPLALAARAAWRGARQPMGPLGVAEPSARTTASRLALRLPKTRLVTAGLGVRMAFEPGHGRTAVPVRSALVGTVVAVTAVVAALVFGTSLVALVSSPHLYGQNWTVKVDVQQPTLALAEVRAVMAGVPAVAGYAAGNYGQVGLAGVPTPAIGVDAVSGGGFGTVLRGREPARPDEIALGAGTMRAHGWRLGQRIAVTTTAEPSGRTKPAMLMHIVGEVVFPSFSEGGFAATDLGQGAQVTASTLSQPYQPTGCIGTLTCYAFILIRYKAGTDLAAAQGHLQSALTAHGCPPGCATITGDQRPSDIRDWTSVRETPLALSALLALLAIAALAHVLLTSVRRRRRDLAVLKTLGLRRVELLQVVSWQATAMAAAALLVGVPAGLLGGRWAWALFADSAGVSPAAEIPSLLVLLVLPATLAAAILIAVWPGFQAGRIRPAVILRRD
jgi:hypothetical protein